MEHHYTNGNSKSTKTGGISLLFLLLRIPIFGTIIQPHCRYIPIINMNEVRTDANTIQTAYRTILNKLSAILRIRTPDYEKFRGRSGLSYHCKGRAVDIWCTKRGSNQYRLTKQSPQMIQFAKEIIVHTAHLAGGICFNKFPLCEIRRNITFIIHPLEIHKIQQREQNRQPIRSDSYQSLQDRL